MNTNECYKSCEEEKCCTTIVKNYCNCGMLNHSAPEYIYNTDDTANNNTTSFATGEDGVLFPNITGFGLTIRKKVKASRSLVGAKITLEVLIATETLWLPYRERIASTVRHGGAFYGALVESVAGSTTDLNIKFGEQGIYPSDTTLTSNSAAWSTYNTAGHRWRVRIDYN